MKKVMEYKGFEIFKRSDGLFEVIDASGSGHVYDGWAECKVAINSWLDFVYSKGVPSMAKLEPRKYPARKWCRED